MAMLPRAFLPTREEMYVAPDLTTPAGWLPVVFMALMGIALLLYVVLDGYDLGVGILLPGGTDQQKDLMVSSIGPFWDANETWLVLGIGLMLVAFPQAHGVVLSSLYMPVVLMLIGLTLRGVAFDFRVKGQAAHKPLWNRLFWAGSLLTALSQGYMLGSYVTGFDTRVEARGFALLTAICVPAAYALLGAGWLLIKTVGELQRKAVYWARRAWWGALTGFIAVSVASPLVSERIFDKWFSLPYIVLLAPLPLATLALLLIAARSLHRLPARLEQNNQYGAWVPFACTVGVVLLGFYGLAYSLFPYLVVDRITIWDAASAPESLMVILAGAAVVLPAILGYTIYVYRVFRGKVEPLSYG
jgi:cytochrome bd ubiquinol oxidase subunit II